MNSICKTPPIEESNRAAFKNVPLVSVCIVTYNHELYINKAIEGVLQQRIAFPYEIVIGEDCSTDGTREIVFSYQKRYPDIIRVITSDNNVGMFNNGTRTERACRGKYIAWCEGDDYWHHPLKLQMQVDYLEAHPDVGFIHSGADTYYVEAKRRSRWIRKPIDDHYDEDAFQKILKSEYVVRTLTVMVRKDLLFNLISKNREFFDDRYLLGDHQRWLFLSSVSKVKFINESLATRNILPESAAHSRDISKVIRMLESLFELKMHFWKKFNCPQEVASVILHKHYEAILGVAFNANNRSVAYETYRKMKQKNIHPTMKQYVFLLGASSKSLNAIIGSIIKARSSVRGMMYR